MQWDRAEIADRLDFLRRSDPGFTRFGCENHRYLLNEPLTEFEVTAFEDRYGVSLPEPSPRRLTFAVGPSASSREACC